MAIPLDKEEEVGSSHFRGGGKMRHLDSAGAAILYLAGGATQATPAASSSSPARVPPRSLFCRGVGNEIHHSNENPCAVIVP